MAVIRITRGKTHNVARYVDFSRSQQTAKNQHVNISVKCLSETSQNSKHTSEMSNSKESTE